MMKVYIGVQSLWTLGYRRLLREGRTDWDKCVARVKKDWEDWNMIKDNYEGEVVINKNGQLEETVEEIEGMICRKFGRI